MKIRNPPMLEQPALTIRDEPDDLQVSLVQTLRGHHYSVLTETSAVPTSDGRRRISFQFPSDLALLATITDYVIKRIERAWGHPADDFAALNIALSEALINAVKHGNRGDTSKLVEFTIDIASDEARFVVEDQGAGFDVEDVPHPREPENLLKSSGRGVLMIRTFMDEARYDNHGKRLTMVMRRPGGPQ